MTCTMEANSPSPLESMALPHPISRKALGASVTVSYHEKYIPTAIHEEKSHDRYNQDEQCALSREG
jgi:hypothetical protein